MSRNDLLEEKDFEPIRFILHDLYGTDFDDASITPVDGGGFSHGYILSTSNNENFFFKISSPAGESSKDEYAESPLEFMEFLSQQGVNVPTPLRNTNGDLSSDIDLESLPRDVAQSITGHKAILMTLVEGNTIPNQVIDKATDKTYSDYADQVGSSVGALHAAQEEATFNGHVPGNQGAFEVTKARLLDIFGFDPDTSMKRLDSELKDPDSVASEQVSSVSENLMQHSKATQSPENRDMMIRMAEAIDNGLFQNIVSSMIAMDNKQTAIADLPQGTVHGDLTTGNFMEAEGNITAVIDFDEIFNGALLWDVAELIVNNFAITDVKSLESEFQSDAAKKTLEAYEAQRPLTEEEIELISNLVAERELTYFSRRLEMVADVMQSNMLGQEQLNRTMPRFDAIMMPYRQLEKIEEVEDMIASYQAEHQGINSDDQALGLPEGDVDILENITQKLENAGVKNGEDMDNVDMPIVQKYTRDHRSDSDKNGPALY